MRDEGSDYRPTPDEIDAMLAFLPIFEADGYSPGDWCTEAWCYDFDEHAERFIQVAYDTSFVYSFDWPQWQPEAERLYYDPQLLETADLQTIRKLITVHLRKERFCEGHLGAMIKDGHVTAILQRLREIRRGMDGEASSAGEENDLHGG